MDQPNASVPSPPSVPSSSVEEFRGVLKTAKNVVILAGAGLSAGSGLKTFRDTDGLWKTYDPKQLATLEAWGKDRSLMWQFHHHRRLIFLDAQLNAGHKTLAALAIPSVRERLTPTASGPPLLVTQNIDSLSPRALDELRANDKLSQEEYQTAQENLIEMHGSAFRTICTACNHINFMYDNNLSNALIDATQHEFAVKDLTEADLPRCGGPNRAESNRYGRCGGLLRPAVIWFGEIPYGMGEISRKLNWTDLLITVGTSALVYPAAGFTKTVRDRGGKVACFNLERTPGDDLCDFLFLGRAEETLPRVFGL